MLEWVPFSRSSSLPRHRTYISAQVCGAYKGKQWLRNTFIRTFEQTCERKFPATLLTSDFNHKVPGADA